MHNTIKHTQPGLSVLSALLLTSCAHGLGSPDGQLVDSITTPTYYIDIREEGGADPKKLKFYVENRRQHTNKVLTGAKAVTPCPAEQPNCVDTIGYKFNDGADNFFITKSGRLSVKRNNQTILWERGDWEEEGGAGQ